MRFVDYLSDTNNKTNTTMKVKIGSYRKNDGEWIEGYQVHRIMKKTAVVGTSLVQCKSGDLPFENGADYYSERYPLDLLQQQIDGAEFTEFKN